MKLYIISGLLLNRVQIISALKTIAEVNFEGMEEIDINEELPELFKKYFIKPESELWKKHGGSYPTLFSFPYCSKSRDVNFILGYEVHTYYRKHVKCKNCPEHSVCDKCIGETNNGWYDIDKIFNEPTPVALEKLCRFCFSDEVESNRRCKCCFRESPDVNRHSISNQYAKFKRFATEILKLTPDTFSISYYYLIDDCLSCT